MVACAMKEHGRRASLFETKGSQLANFGSLTWLACLDLPVGLSWLSWYANMICPTVAENRAADNTVSAVTVELGPCDAL